MRNVLHDEHDELEAIQEKWRESVEEIRANVAIIAANATDFRDVLTAANVLVADVLAGLTTEAAQSGFKFGVKKAGMRDVGNVSEEEESEAD
jgi:hypothetical protein